MALEQHPFAFRFEGRWWVSETPREEAHARLEAQRDWDRRNARAQRWWVSITIGAVLGVALAFGLGVLVNLAPFVYLISLPVGFGVGAVVAALINKRIQGADAAHESMPKRPTIPAPDHPRAHTRAARRRAQGNGSHIVRRPHPLVEAGLCRRQAGVAGRHSRG